MNGIFTFLKSIPGLALNNKLLTLSILIFSCFILELLRIFYYEKRINILYKEKQEKIEKADKGMKAIAERRIEAIEKEYRVKIDELERKRRFILDKLPFFKK